MSKHALVVGGMGVIGRNLVSYLEKLEGWEVTAISRRTPDFNTKAKYLSIDLLERQIVEEARSHLEDVTHIFYAAYQERTRLANQVLPNLTMLRNIVEVVDTSSVRLRHVNLIQGGKAYGCHLGPFKTPAKETDPRHLPPNFYYDLEDFLRSRSDSENWSWSALRPEAVCGFAVGNPMNLVMAIAVYATICHEYGLPLRFPGQPGAYRALYQVTGAEVLAKAMVWAGTTEACRHEIFNITNGDLFRWEHLWPRFAEFFGLEYAPPQTISLVEMMADKAPVWNAIVNKYGLQPYPFDQIVAWDFADFIFGCDWDVISDVNKARRYGFHEMVVDSGDMFVQLFQRLKDSNIIP